MSRLACVVCTRFDRDAIPVSRRLSWNSGNVGHGSGPGRSHEKKPVRVTENWQQQIILFPVPVPMSASVAVYSLGQWLWHERMSPLQFSRETQWLMACNQCSDKYSRCYICSRKILKVAGENIGMNTKTKRKIRGHCLKPSTYGKIITAVPSITDYQWLSLTMDHWWDVCIGN